ncbi:hypothetical protein MAIT1_02217 [Magnetofaba australis IT-1]|uniref:Uncharacterized protein n=1 Tax=Magnetofaba australis IT-1 TaxID=1434232 RepID=A0A1Y2K4S9_9PROT|nr:hypothetical protein MAIT1_02217 [Magnetofaba australis IT-1]
MIQAQPLDSEEAAFFFHSIEEWNSKRTELEAEEYEMSYVSGPHEELFDALFIDHETIQLWYEKVRELKQIQRAALYYLYVFRAIPLAKSLEELEQLAILGGAAGDVAEEMLEESGVIERIPDEVRDYIDWERLASDWSIAGKLISFAYEGVNWVVVK